MIATISGISAATSRQSLVYRAIKPVIIEAVEGQDSDNPAYITLIVTPAGSQYQGCSLAAGPSSIPGGQVTWSGLLTLDHDEEVRAYFDYSAVSDRLYLTLKLRDQQ